MNVFIQIFYTSNDNTVMRRGQFPLKGKTKEQLAFEFWTWIKRESPFEAFLEKVICDGEEITDLVKSLQDKKYRLP
nr:hypothetical protein [Neobacillus sp. Marseille-Q6967]